MTSSDSRSPDRMRGLTRRSLLKGGAALVALHASRLLSPSAAAASAKPRVAVVGAGAFGGWTALHLVRRGARVVLLDAWGPGNSRASSGGRSEEHTSELQSHVNLVCRLLLEKKKKTTISPSSLAKKKKKK